MSSSKNFALALDQWRIILRTIQLACFLLISVPATAAETVTMGMASQVLDLDAGTVSDSLATDPAGSAGADVQLAYNADRTPHSVVVPIGEGVEMAFVAGVGFDGITSSDLESLTFSAEPGDQPFSADDCVVVRTDQGAYFKLGNASESALSITFNYEQL